MEDREFFEHIHQIWARTTGAENMYWMPEVDYVEENDGEPDREVFHIYAVNQEQEKKLLASYLTSEDADFITAVHGCFGDLIRQLINSMDEADRLDEEKDDLIVRIAELEMDIDDLEDGLAELKTELTEANSYADEKRRENDDLRDEISALQAELDFVYGDREESE